MRLRTLPLSEAGALLGVFIAGAECRPSVWTVVFLLLTTALLQILSNLSNELGDCLHGTDNEGRQGIHYSLQDGELTIPQMRRLISVVAVLCCVSGAAMVWFSFGTFLAAGSLALLALGAAAIWAAMHYTLGDNPYGYRGLGDIFVFVFFGLVSVYGSYYVCTHNLCNLPVLLPAAGIGCFSVGVLNINNIRDMVSDAATRTTVAIRMGGRNARIYQTVLMIAGWAFLTAFTALTGDSAWNWIYLATLPLYALNLNGIWHKEERALDPMLPMLVLSTFLTVLLMGLGMFL